MMNTMIDRRRDLLRIRVELAGIRPLIWREILVPASYSFWDLHVAIQDAMGWLDYHLHEFRIRSQAVENTVLIGIPSDELWENLPKIQPGWEIPVTEHLREPGEHAEYEYDFGDSWIHAISLVSIEPRETGARYPQCVRGERACPPEDCGGIHGYQELLEALLDPVHPEHESIKRWIPKGWGPEVFGPDKVRFDDPRRRWEQAFLSRH
jgi:hypothetical protein